MGWINSPVKQALTEKEKDNVDKTAKKDAEKDLTEKEGNLVDEFYDAATGENVKVYSKSGEGDSDTGRSWEDGYKIAQDKYGTDETFDEWKARAIKEKQWEERTKQPDSEPGEKDYETKNLATLLAEKGLSKFYNTKYYDSATEKMVKHTDESFMEQYGHDKRFTDVFAAYRDSKRVGDDADQSVYDDVNQGTNVEKGQVEKSKEQEPDKEDASGKTVFDSPTQQLSPVRQLMNKYMPSKSMAKQEEVTTPGKPEEHKGKWQLGIQNFPEHNRSFPPNTTVKPKKKKKRKGKKKENNPIKQKEVTLPEFEIEFDPSSSDYKYNKETGEETLMTPEEKLHARKENLKTGTGRTTTSYTDPKTGEKIQVGGDKITAMFQRKK